MSTEQSIGLTTSMRAHAIMPELHRYRVLSGLYIGYSSENWSFIWIAFLIHFIGSISLIFGVLWTYFIFLCLIQTNS